MADAARPAWVDEELFPFESRFIDIDRHTVHYVDEGSGPTLLLLHGNPTWSFDYRDVIRTLRDEFRCVALDYPGFGLSSAGPGYRYLPEEHAALVVDFIDRLGLSDATLVAHDWEARSACTRLSSGRTSSNASSSPTPGHGRWTATCSSRWPPACWVDRSDVS